MIDESKLRNKATWRPEAPNGAKVPFNCCSYPDVWEGEDVAACRNCGYEWTGAMPDE